MRLRLRSALGTSAIVLALAAITILVIVGGQKDHIDEAAPNAASEHGHQLMEEAAVPQLAGRGDPAAGAAVLPAESPPARGPTAWTVTATVRSREIDDYRGWARPTGGDLLPGATVRLWLVGGGETELIAQGTTDSSGGVTLDLQEMTSRSRNRLSLGRIVGHAEAPGHYEWRGKPIRTGRLLDENLELMSRLMTFTLGASPVVRGQVVCDGKPLRFAYVSLAPADGKSKRGGFAFTDPEGRYAVAIPGPGEFQVRSDRRDVEVGSTDRFRVDGIRDVDAPPLLLHKLPEKRGVVRYEDGTPVSNLAFEIDHPGFNVHADPWVPDLGRVQARTDDRGAFSAILPTMGDMGGRLKVGFTVRIPGVEAQKTGFDPKATSSSITLQPHRLRVQLRDDQGSPLPGQEVSFFLAGKRWRAASGQTDEYGEVSLFVSPGARGHLFVVGAGHASTTHAIEIPAIGNESVVTLDLPDRRSSGRLAFRMRTPTGEPVFPVKVAVKTPEGHIFAERDFKSDDDGMVLPPGTYSVRLLSSKKHPSWKDVNKIRSFVKLDEQVVVRAGKTTTIDVEWTPTAALAVKLLVGGEMEGALEESRAFLEPAGGERRRVSMSPRWGYGYGRLRANEWLFTTWLQDPGSYLLTIEAAGFRTIARHVDLVQEEVTKVEMALERAP